MTQKPSERIEEIKRDIQCLPIGPIDESGCGHYQVIMDDHEAQYKAVLQYLDEEAEGKSHSLSDLTEFSHGI